MESENLYSENPVMNTNLSEVLKVWGIDYNDEKVVLDPYYATDVEIKKEGKKTFLSRLKIPNNNKNDGIMKNLKSFNFGSAGYLELAKQEGVEAEILLKSSKKASLLDLNKLLEINDLSSLITYYDDENTKEYPLIVKLKGEFNSAFVEPPSRIIGKKWTNDHKIHSSKEAEIIAVSDVDFLYEGFWAKRTYENGLKPVIHSVASNGDFVVSVIDYFSGRDFLNALKSKKKKDLRVLSKISDYINEIGTVYKKKEKMLEISLLELRKKMNEIMYGGKDVNNLSNDLDTLKLLDSEIFKAKREISILREDMLNKVNIMLNKIIWINTLAMPLFMLFLYFGLFLLKRKK
ncbi:MAG: hypothetical protein BWY78_01175 [Alphaproteobacteria bacterium ADurb.Bin438]|nr:MAG: hypothetical protein BWY78_01175 [Alphaproteobacteria bacterium ADurb.Bin438]